MALRAKKGASEEAVARGDADSAYDGVQGEKKWFDYIVSKYPKYKVLDGLNQFDIVLYKIQNERNPDVLAEKMKIGDYGFKLDLQVHTKIGDRNLPIVCNDQISQSKELCFIDGLKWDNWNALGGKQADKKAQKYEKDFLAYLPSRRLLMFVKPTMGEQKGQICLADMPYKGTAFGAKLFAKAKRWEDKNKMKLDYTSNELDGKTIEFYSEKKGDSNWPEYDEFDFVERKESVTDEEVHSLPDIWDLVVLASNEEIETYMRSGELPSEFKKQEHTPTTSKEDEEYDKKCDAEELNYDKEEGEKADREHVEKQAAKAKAKAKEEAAAKAKEESKEDGEFVCVSEGRSFGDFTNPTMCKDRKTCPNKNECRQASKGK